MRRLEISGPNGTIGGIETGSGPPVVLVAGLGSTHRIWGELPRVLGRSFRVLAPDNRGVGGSRDGAPFTLDRAAEDIVTVIEHLAPGPVRLLGVSMGGIIALKAALAAPERIARMVLGSCAAHLSTHGRRSLELLRDLLVWVPPRRMGADLMTLAFAPPFIEQYTPLVEQAAETYGMADEDLPGARVQIEGLLSGWDLRPDLASIRCPALVLAGVRDPVVAVEDTEVVARGLARAELLRVPEAAHSVLAEGGAGVLARVHGFLGGDQRANGPAGAPA
jgi:3-oxoadipate enol-lactonase